MCKPTKCRVYVKMNVAYPCEASLYIECNAAERQRAGEVSYTVLQSNDVPNEIILESNFDNVETAKQYWKNNDDEFTKNVKSVKPTDISYWMYDHEQ